ncbi:MAG: hypothetical protein KBE91_01495 [Bacteroidia bacterium]|nr:hypothetical protein [Bacteroidia bacterium]
MALTIHQQPQEYTPAYNDQFILALSNQIAQPDFKYIVTVQVNSGVIYTLDVLQRPDGYIVVNPIEIVKNFINRDYFNPYSGQFTAEGYSCEVSVNIKEYYLGAVQSNNYCSYIAIDACLTNEEFENYDYTDYITVGANYKMIDSFNNVDSRVTLNTNYWITFYNTVATQIDFNVYDASSTLIGTFNTSLVANTFNTIDVGKAIISGLPNAASVEIDFNDGVSSYFTAGYNVSTICSKHTTYPLYYLNRFGVISYMWFNQLTKQTVDAKRSYVRLGANSRMGNTYGTSSYIRERHAVNIETTKRITLTTGWLSQEQSLKLVELFDSPIVWFVKNGIYYPVSVTDSNYTINEHEYEPLFNYAINLEMDKTEQRQRGL